MMTSLLLWIVFGALIGWIASMIMDTDREQGAMGNIIVGIVGALVGGFISQMLGGPSVRGFDLASILVAMLGAVVVLFVYKRVARHHHSAV